MAASKVVYLRSRLRMKGVFSMNRAFATRRIARIGFAAVLLSLVAGLDIANAQTASLDWSLFPVVVLETGVLLLLGLSNRRFSAWYGGAARWIILVPLWGVALYALFGTLSAFLPSSL